jgi:ribA/ribD-fused uncharacterized protein
MADIVKKKSPSGEWFTMFWGGIYSQWYTKAPFRTEVPVADQRVVLEFNCCEQYMMYMKAATFGDWDTAEKVMRTLNPKEQKQLGREVKPFDRDVWNSVARQIVYDGNYAKFTQHRDLKIALLSTAGSTLVEASPVDKIWGIGLAADNPLALDRKTWKGTNWLGEAITQVRNDILKK